MRIVQLVDKGHLILNEVVTSRAAEGEMLVKVETSGAYGSDLHSFDTWNTAPLGPRSLGHETTGMVEEIGPGINRVRPSNWVVIEPGFFCARWSCRWCRAGCSQLCARRGVWRDHQLGAGGFTKHEITPESNLFPKPSRIDLDIAALADIYACSFHTARRADSAQCRSAAVVDTGKSVWR